MNNMNYEIQDFRRLKIEVNDMNNMNSEIQNYRGLKLQLKERTDYRRKRAKEYNIISSRGYFTDITIWIPNRYLYSDGEINMSMNFMFIFNKEDVINKLFEAGYELTY